MNYNFDEKELFGLFVDENSYRPELNYPYRRDGYVYATDRHKLIRVKEDIVSGDYEVTDKMKLNIPTDNCDYIISDKNIEKALSEIPKVKEVEEKEVECSECDGTGEVDWEYRDKNGKDYEGCFECPVCDGTGYVYSEVATGKMIPDPTTTVKVGKNSIYYIHLKALLDAMRVIGVTEVRLVCQDGIINHFRIDENISVIIASNIGAPECELEMQKGGGR